MHQGPSNKNPLRGKSAMPIQPLIKGLTASDPSLKQRFKRRPKLPEIFQGDTFFVKGLLIEPFDSEDFKAQEYQNQQLLTFFDGQRSQSPPTPPERPTKPQSDSLEPTETHISSEIREFPHASRENTEINIDADPTLPDSKVISEPAEIRETKREELRESREPWSQTEEEDWDLDISVGSVQHLDKAEAFKELPPSPPVPKKPSHVHQIHQKMRDVQGHFVDHTTFEAPTKVVPVISDENIPPETEEDRDQVLLNAYQDHMAVGELVNAYRSLQQISPQSPKYGDVQKLLPYLEKRLKRNPYRYLPSMESRPVLKISLNELSQRKDLDPQSAYILTLIDGRISLDLLIDLSNIPREEAAFLILKLWGKDLIALD